MFGSKSYSQQQIGKKPYLTKTIEMEGNRTEAGGELRVSRSVWLVSVTGHCVVESRRQQRPTRPLHSTVPRPSNDESCSFAVTGSCAIDAHAQFNYWEMAWNGNLSRTGSAVVANK